MTNAPKQWAGRGIVRGAARGPVILSRTPLSFLGDIDIRTGNVVGEMSDLRGRSIRGTVLVVPSTRGSAGAWRFLYQLKKHGTHPVAIITDDLPDPSVVQGAILSKVPIVANLAEAISADISDGTAIEVDGETGKVHVLD